MMIKELFFKCELISDVVLNASLATEGNMTTLNYIPGSNFLGIVASKVYPLNKDSEEEIFHLFHSGNVSFGDAVKISNDGQNVFYPKPFSYFKDKLKINQNIYLHHLIDPKDGIKDESGNKIQLKQERSGFLDSNGTIIEEVKKTFALKSAQDRDSRTSKEGAMFGFESMKAGQTFVFSVRYEDEKDIELVKKHLAGKCFIGKSKSAQYGEVCISEIESIEKISSFEPDNFTLVYAESNLSFIDENTGQTTFQPTVAQLGLTSGSISWDKSSIRTYSYSPWNFIRNASNGQRDCIAKGSVFFVEDAKASATTKSVGEYQAEGLGRIIYNPVFLEGNADCSLGFNLEIIADATTVSKNIIPDEENIETPLGIALFKRYNDQKGEKEIAANVIEALNVSSSELKKYITSSQWGNIRALATDYYRNGKSYEDLLLELFYESTREDKERGIKNSGMLTHGKMYDKLWDKNGRLNTFKVILNSYSNKSLIFVAKYAAEMAKIYIDIQSGKIVKDK